MTSLEKEALYRSVASVREAALRDTLQQQIGFLSVRARKRTGVGFYTDFSCPAPQCIRGLQDSFNKTPPSAAATHPNGKDSIDFLVYVKDGAISFLEGACTTASPENEEDIVFGTPPGS